MSEYDSIKAALAENMRSSKKEISEAIATEMAKRGTLDSSAYSDAMAKSLTDLFAKYNIDVAEIGLQERRMKEAKDLAEKQEAQKKRDSIINAILGAAGNLGYIFGGLPGAAIKGAAGAASNAVTADELQTPAENPRFDLSMMTPAEIAKIRREHPEYWPYKY